jgi:hypothetical protein
MDGIFLATSMTNDLLPTTVKVLRDHNLGGKVKIGKIDTVDTMGDYIETGELSMVYGGQIEIKLLTAVCFLVNKLIGTPLSDTPVVATVGFTVIQTMDDVDNFYKYFYGGVPIYTKEEVQKYFIKYFNPEITAESVKKIAGEFSLTDVMKRHADLVK